MGDRRLSYYKGGVVSQERVCSDVGKVEEGEGEEEA